MAEITLKGNPVHTYGDLPMIGSHAPDFVLTRTDLADVSLKDFAGQRVVLNILVSIETSVCATSVRKFNTAIDKLGNSVVLCASLDVPFAHERFCSTEGLERVVPVTELRKRGFGEDYGVRMVDGPLAGLFSRAVVIIDENGKVVYTEQVPEISQEPDYDAALKALGI